MIHPRHHEDAHEILRLLDAAHRFDHAQVVVDRIAWSDVLIRPAMRHDEFSAQPIEGGQVWFGRVENRAKFIGRFGHDVEIFRISEVERFPIPFRVSKDHELKVAGGNAEWVVNVSRPFEFAALFVRRPELLACCRMLQSVINLGDGIHLSGGQAIIGIVALAQQRGGIEIALARIVNQAVLDAISLIASGKRGVVDERQFLLRNEVFRGAVRDPRGMEFARPHVRRKTRRSH